MPFNIDDYPIITFSRKDTNSSYKTKGRQVGAYLAVSTGKPQHFRIFNLQSGKPLLQGDFPAIYDAIYTADFLNHKYAKYFEIWEAFPDMDIFALVKWTIQDGLRLYEMIKILREKKLLSKSTVKEAFDAAQHKTGKWIALGG